MAIQLLSIIELTNAATVIDQRNSDRCLTMNAAMLTTIRPTGVMAPMIGMVQRLRKGTRPRGRSSACREVRRPSMSQEYVPDGASATCRNRSGTAAYIDQGTS